MREITITTDYINLMQLIKLAGLVGNGSDVKMMVDENSIKVNGVVAYRYRRKLYDGDVVLIDDEILLVVVHENQ